MNRRFLLAASVVGLATLSQVETADAGRFRFSGGGRVHARVSGGVSVGWGSRPVYRPMYRPSWHVSGRIYVGPRYSYYPRYRYYYYQPVPSYYGYYSTQTYYPVQPATSVTVAAPAPRRELPRFGIGLFAGGVSVEQQDDSSDWGALARLRLTDGLLIEGELGKTTYASDLREDRRVGASLVYEIGARNKFAPYVLAGIGVQQANVGDGEYKSTQDFGELGVGLRFAATPNFHLLLDVRAGTRQTIGGDEVAPVDTAARMATPPAIDSDESEEYTRARLAAVLFF